MKHKFSALSSLPFHILCAADVHLCQDGARSLNAILVEGVVLA